jgi:glutamyl-tRNA reductase
MIGLIGFDHQRASLALRGRLSFTGDRLDDALHVLHASRAVSEVVLLSTCNRTEVYIAAPEWEPARAAVEQLLGAVYSESEGTAKDGGAPTWCIRADEAAGLTVQASAIAAVAVPSELTSALYERQETDAVRHLFRVAAGLESMVMGEAQILGQVKDALTAAERAGTVSDELRAVFVAALKAGKRVRAETEIGRADVSVAGLAVRVARERLGGLEGKAALVIGAGKTSQLSAQLLRAEGIKPLVLANRSLRIAEELAYETGGEAIALERVGEALGRVALVISATAAPHPILSAATIAASRISAETPLLLIDLAVPADIEAAAGTLPGISLLSLDALRALDGGAVPAPETASVAEAVVLQAETILGEALREYQRGQNLRQMVPSIASLRQHVDRSEQAELARALSQLAHLSPEERAVIERFGQRLVDKMFHHLVSRIRSLAEYDEVAPHITMQVLARLFADPDAPAGQE